VATPVRRIVDSSPPILLAEIGQLDLLRAGVPEILCCRSPQHAGAEQAWKGLVGRHCLVGCKEILGMPR
jgi:hypothetical protein